MDECQNIIVGEANNQCTLAGISQQEFELLHLLRGPAKHQRISVHFDGNWVNLQTSIGFGFCNKSLKVVVIVCG